MLELCVEERMTFFKGIKDEVTFGIRTWADRWHATLGCQTGMTTWDRNLGWFLDVYH